MKTINLISTPQIIDNIGSCSSKVERVYTYNGYIKYHGYDISINSCTGYTEKTYFSEVSLIGMLIPIVLLVALFIICLVWILDYHICGKTRYI